MWFLMLFAAKEFGQGSSVPSFEQEGLTRLQAAQQLMAKLYEVLNRSDGNSSLGVYTLLATEHCFKLHPISELTMNLLHLMNLKLRKTLDQMPQVNTQQDEADLEDSLVPLAILKCILAAVRSSKQHLNFAVNDMSLHELCC